MPSKADSETESDRLARYHYTSVVHARTGQLIEQDREIPAQDLIFVTLR